MNQRSIKMFISHVQITCFYTSGRLNYHECPLMYRVTADTGKNFTNRGVSNFLLRKRKENKRDLLHSVNTNENHYQFDVVLILLCADFVIYVLEIQCG